jgi:hypothetical protein
LNPSSPDKSEILNLEPEILNYHAELVEASLLEEFEEVRRS